MRCEQHEPAERPVLALRVYGQGNACIFFPRCRSEEGWRGLLDPAAPTASGDACKIWPCGENVCARALAAALGSPLLPVRRGGAGCLAHHHRPPYLLGPPLPGRWAYVTATAPHVMLRILLIRGVTPHPGLAGCLYLYPDSPGSDPQVKS